MIANQSLGENSEFILKVQSNLHTTDCTWLGPVLMAVAMKKQSLHALFQCSMSEVDVHNLHPPGEQDGTRSTD